MITILQLHRGRGSFRTPKSDLCVIYARPLTCFPFHCSRPPSLHCSLYTDPWLDPSLSCPRSGSAVKSGIIAIWQILQILFQNCKFCKMVQALDLDHHEDDED